MNRFIDHYKDENVTTKYDAGIVHKYGNDFIIAYEQRGAKDTFSIGQPVYDKLEVRNKRTKCLQIKALSVLRGDTYAILGKV